MGEVRNNNWSKDKIKMDCSFCDQEFKLQAKEDKVGNVTWFYECVKCKLTKEVE